MESFVIYLFKSAGLLSLFYIFYSILLKNETSFQTNRQFFLGGIVASTVLPAIYFTRTVFVEATTHEYFFTKGDFPITETIPAEPAISPYQILFIFYILGIIFMTARLSLQFYSLCRVLLSGRKFRRDNTVFVITDKRIAPFSFLNHIVYNPTLHAENELTHIFKHEKIHVTQFHSADVLLANLNLIYQWFNPFAWLYLKNLQQNLEYIADCEAVKEVPCKKEYQKALVKISVKNPNLALTNNFYQSLIKKRIIMLNKKNSARSNYWKAGFIIPALLAFLLIFNVKTVAQVVEKEIVASEGASEMEISVTISETTKQEQLDRYIQLFEKYDVQLTFKNIEYTSEGLLSSITAEFLDRNSNSSGTIERNAAGGIDDFTFYYNKEKGSGFRSGKSYAGDNHYLLSNLGQDPLIVVEGKKYTSTQLAEKTIKVLGGVSSLDPLQAEKTYGEAAKDGALIIDKGQILEDFEAELKEIDLKDEAVKNNYIQISKGAKPSFITLNNDPSTSGVSVGTGTKVRQNVVFVKKDSTTGSQPVYILNGKTVNATSLDSIDEVNIDSINVLKGSNAVKAYGKKGENGVVVIHTDNDTARVSRTANNLYFASPPTYVKNKSISITSTGNANDTTRNKTTSYIRTLPAESFVVSVDSADIHAYQYSTRTSPSQTIFYLPGDQEKPLYVVNGKEMEENFNVKSIGHENIASINVLKGETATKEYGKRGENGVIQITTQDKIAQGSPSGGTFSIIKASTTDEGLKITKEKLQERSNLEVEFKDIKRNRDGLIREIRIIAKTENEEIIGKFSETENISDIYVGVLNNKIYISSNPPRK